VIAGRALQGAGAVSSVVVALAADLTREQHRTKAMAMIGSTIGLAFALSLIIAPLLYRWIGLSGVFYVMGALSLIAIWLLFAAVPKAPPPAHAEPPVRARDLPSLLMEAELVRLNVGIFVLHVSQMAMFVVVPPMLVEAGLALPLHWKFYLPVVLVSFVLMVPAVFYADRRNHHKTVLLGTVLLLVLVELGLTAAPDRIMPLAGLMLAFFVAFNVLEALLPSLVSRIAPARARHRHRGLQHDPDPGAVRGRAAWRMARASAWTDRRVQRLRRTGGRVAAGRGGHASPRATACQRTGRVRRFAFTGSLKLQGYSVRDNWRRGRDQWLR